MFIISLKNQKEFNLVNKLGVKLYSSCFLAIVARKFSAIPSSSSNAIFLGMKVGKKLGKAVVRNKIKRRIRHLIVLISKSLTVEQNRLGVIIIPKKGFEKISFADLLVEFNKISLVT